MPASRARKLSQLMSEGGSLDTNIDSSGTSGAIGGGGVTVYATTNDLPEPGPPARNTALKIEGSFTPSIKLLCSLKLIICLQLF